MTNCVTYRAIKLARKKGHAYYMKAQKAFEGASRPRAGIIYTCSIVRLCQVCRTPRRHQNYRRHLPQKATCKTSNKPSMYSHPKLERKFERSMKYHSLDSPYSRYFRMVVSLLCLYAPCFGGIPNSFLLRESRRQPLLRAAAAVSVPVLHLVWEYGLSNPTGKL